MSCMRTNSPLSAVSSDRTLPRRNDLPAPGADGSADGADPNVTYRQASSRNRPVRFAGVEELHGSEDAEPAGFGE